MAEITSGSGFSEATKQMEEAAKAAQVAREAADTAALAKAQERFHNAQQAAQAYTSQK